jgi:hypothetical protein
MSRLVLTAEGILSWVNEWIRSQDASGDCDGVVVSGPVVRLESANADGANWARDLPLRGARSIECEMVAVEAISVAQRKLSLCT